MEIDLAPPLPATLPPRRTTNAFERSVTTLRHATRRGESGENGRAAGTAGTAAGDEEHRIHPSASTKTTTTTTTTRQALRRRASKLGGSVSNEATDATKDEQQTQAHELTSETTVAVARALAILFVTWVLWEMAIRMA